MSLRLRLLPAVLVLLGVYCAGELLIRDRIFEPTILASERARAERLIRRSLAAFHREQEHLSLLCHDWAWWDDTYAFVDEPDEDYLESNLLLESFTDNQLNLLGILDRQRHVVWQQVHDLEADGAPLLHLPEFPATTWPADHPILQARDADGKLQGLYNTSHGVMLVAAAPILHSDNAGPSRGTFVMGRFLEPAIAAEIADQAQVEVVLQSLTGGAWSESERELAQTLGSTPQIVQGPLDQPVEAYAALRDVTGRPLVLCRAQLDRDEVQAGLDAARAGLAWGAVIVLLLALLAGSLLDRGVLRPLAQLSQQAREITATGDLSVPLALERRDELGLLAQQLAAMTERLAQDQAARAAAELHSREQEARYRQLVDAAPFGVALLTPTGDVVLGNPALGSALGTPLEALEADTWAVVSLDDDLRRASESGAEVAGVQHTSGGRVLRYWFSPVFAADQLVALHALVEDITETALLEGRLRQTGKLEALGRLSGGIAHNFNNLLAAIIGYADLLETDSDLSAEDLEAVRQIHAAGDRGADLVRHLMAFNQGRTTQPAPLDLAPLLRGVQRMLEPVLGDPVRLQVEVDGQPGVVAADQLQLEQALVELVLNARDALPDGGTITLGLAERELTSAQPSYDGLLSPGQYLVVTVADDGLGMDPATLTRAFEPFFSTKATAGGVGLGLASVYGTVKQAGGGITCDSTPGAGTVFTLYFPRLVGDVAMPVPPRSRSGDLPCGRETILVVEDEDTVREIVREMLTRLGYHVLEAAGGPAALALLAEHPRIDLLLTDLMMPDLNGAELVREVTRLRPEIRVVVMSGHAEGLADEPQSGGRPVARLAKPFSLRRLASTIRRTLDSPADAVPVAD